MYAHYRAAWVIEDEQLMAGLRGEVVTQVIHPYVERLSKPQTFLDANKGTIWSMRLGGVDLTDPLAAAEALAATKHVHWPLWISIVIPVVATLILGKVFCSWICPGYLLFEITGKLRKLLRIAEIEPANVRFAFANKYIFLVVGLGLSAAFSAPLFALIYPPAVISRVIHAWVFGTALTGMLVVLAAIVAIEVFVSPRWWCQTMCPGGALYGLLGAKRLLRVKLRTDACTGCRDCIPVCEAGINPITRSTSIECDNCGVCTRHCGPAALHYTLALPGLNRSKSSVQPQARGRRAVPAVIGVLVWLMLGSPAAGHHILGLPHYSYKENYPQRPTLEYPAQTGPFDVLLTSYPGVPTPAEPANLAFYIKNRVTGTVYADSVTVRVLQTRTFGDNIVVVPPTQRAPFDNEHKLQCIFPEDGEYIVELSLMVEGRQEIIPFLMVAGQPTATASMVVASLGATLFVFVVIRAVQKKRRRARLRQSAESKINTAALPI
ncbi:MAG: 4Fe-4S binding protein [Phycisphaerae bacterium]